MEHDTEFYAPLTLEKDGERTLRNGSTEMTLPFARYLLEKEYADNEIAHDTSYGYGDVSPSFLRQFESTTRQLADLTNAGVATIICRPDELLIDSISRTTDERASMAANAPDRREHNQLRPEIIGDYKQAEARAFIGAKDGQTYTVVPGAYPMVGAIDGNNQVQTIGVIFTGRSDDGKAIDQAVWHKPSEIGALVKANVVDLAQKYPLRMFEPTKVDQAQTKTERMAMSR